MPFMTRIPSDLARFGLKVELVPGWDTRGSSSFAPACVVDHWTAGPRATKGRPSLSIVTYGRQGLDGPLCNIYLARDATCVVVAAGRANHAGPGGFRGLVGNSAAYGIEAESGGDGDWTEEQLNAYPRLNAALLSGIGRDASWVAGHCDWAPDRKIDIRDIIAQVRAKTAVVLANPGATAQEDDMTPEQAKQLDQLHTIITDGLWKDRDKPPFYRGELLDRIDRAASILTRGHSDGADRLDDEWVMLQAILAKTGSTASAVDATSLATALVTNLGADFAKRVVDEMTARLAA